MIVYSLIESPAHPDLGSLYRDRGAEEIKLTSSRKAIIQLKKKSPDILVAEFFYGYGNNYAGVNISNLDVLLYSMQKYAPKARLIIFVNPEEYDYVGRLGAIFPIHTVLKQPVSRADMEAVLDDLSGLTS